MQDSKYSVVDKISFRPNKVVFYKQFILNKYDVPQENTREIKNIVAVASVAKLVNRQVTVSNRHYFEISTKASSRIKEKVTWLYELARNKTVQTSSGKVLYSFKMNFITLTIPSIQRHETAIITKECLNQFLTECKHNFNLQNYVWRLEFQKNGNAHYHIATDTFISYEDAKLIWNRCLNKLGYIDDYQEKFSGMSFEKYREMYSENGVVPFETLRARYGRGCATKWDSPNTVDVRAVSNAKNIAFYIAKYITKNSQQGLNTIVLAREPETTNLRLWFCSRSLSALDKIELFCDEWNELAEKCLSALDNVKRYIFDYCSVWYFNVSDQIFSTKRDLWLLYRQYASERGYIPAI